MAHTAASLLPSPPQRSEEHGQKGRTERTCVWTDHFWTERICSALNPLHMSSFCLRHWHFLHTNMQKKTAKGQQAFSYPDVKNWIPFLSVSDTAHHFQLHGQTLNLFKQYLKSAKPVPTGYCGAFPMCVCVCECECVHACVCMRMWQGGRGRDGERGCYVNVFIFLLLLFFVIVFIMIVKHLCASKAQAL